MSAASSARAVESRAVEELLDAVAQAPAGLIFEGDPGIGKTTLWLDAIDRARERGFVVLSSRPAAAESVLAYASLGDILASVDPQSWTDLPQPQQHALDRVLLRAEGGAKSTDRRAVAAALLSVLERLGRSGPVLLAIDDLQWMDPSSAHVLAFVARRISGPIGILGAVRTGPDGSPTDWLQLPRPERLRRIGVRAMSSGALHEVVTERLARTFSRPTMLKIHQTSGGNPFYALELARAIDENPDGADRLPGSLNELVQARLGSLDPGTTSVLLAIASLASPTVDIVAKAIDQNPDVLLEMLEAVERQAIVTLEGHRIRFTHPLLARGVYARASGADRRAMHRTLAGLVEEAELRARHLALATTQADDATLAALDAAAEAARRRGAPEASAELVGLAIRLGGDSPERRMRLASYQFNAGDTEEARILLEKTIDGLQAGAVRARAMYLLGVVRMFDDGFIDAADLLARALDETGADSPLRPEMLITLAFAQINSSRSDDAKRNAEEAVALAEQHGMPGRLAQALGMQTTLRFMAGEGLDQAALDRAIALEDTRTTVPIAIRPSVEGALLASWSGRFVEAGKALDALRRRCIEYGEDSELVFVCFHSTLTAIWRSDYAAAARAVADTAERAPQLGGDVPKYIELATKAMLGVHVGDVDVARRDAEAALAAGLRSGALSLSQWPVMALGFLDVSLERYDAALATLTPLLTQLDTERRGTEIIAAWFLPDAIESMVQLGRLDDAEPWVQLLEDNGRRLDRPWMLAVGGRCRGMLLGARGDLTTAVRATEDALTHHDRVAMPFEQARTHLLLGQLQRRQRLQDTAANTIGQAIATFSELGTATWAARAHAQLVRTNLGPRGADTLTPSERRVAELAASGMTNRDVAAALYISPKTVEANLSKVYQKLGIRSRAELGRRIGELST